MEWIHIMNLTISIQSQLFIRVFRQKEGIFSLIFLFNCQLTRKRGRTLELPSFNNTDTRSNIISCRSQLHFF